MKKILLFSDKGRYYMHVHNLDEIEYDYFDGYLVYLNGRPIGRVATDEEIEQADRESWDDE